ncbi:hypothetical protein IV203_034510 [Nitzschia inconspicua]|uniref:Uncharacterized protein n=1 Tax=Nitzschia inconspicua TaxID=303405 RepID=A0A9K3K969_9STRA|nr:hypothetical protein IV203_002693 [Nitzschia inconspicua]KAG7339514.1 hypothetical protein IV203_002567 [Nitzschia inconspicua]KAG7359412.1 hypothetical protein IV203_034510 [Nitzschia inconspicua]
MMSEEDATPVIKPTDAIEMLAFWSEPIDLWPSSPALLGNLGSCSNSSKSSESSTKSVRFSTVEVREYPITIGDNLSVADGVPHTIEWDYLPDETRKMNVNQYERKRPIQQRRQGESLILDSQTRERRLRSVGYTTQDFLDAIRAREVALRTLYQ